MTTQESARARHSLQNSPLSNVYLRIKPRSETEVEENYAVLNPTTLLVKKGDSVERKFIFKKIFESRSSQIDVFDQCTRQRVIDLISGQSSSIVAYGASDSGKTYTLYGTPEWPGIIPRSIEFIFSAVNCTLQPWYKVTDDNQVVSLNDAGKLQEIQNKLKLINSDVIEKEDYDQARLSLDNSVLDCVDVEERETCGGDGIFSAWLSIAEIYNDNIYDLLAVDHQERRQLKVSTRKDGSTYVKGLNFVNVSTGLEACQLLILAQSRMTVAANGNNGTSSRSHTLFTIRLLKYRNRDATNEVEVSTLTFCDMAGSGRSKSVKDDAVTSAESKSIKYSLLVFGRCLKSVRDSYSNGEPAVGPFRESKLTRVLQKALTGKEHVSFIITIDTTDQFHSETMGILNLSVIVRKIESESRDFRRGQFAELTPRSLKAYLIPIIGETPRKTTVSVEEYESVKRQNEELLEELEDLKKSRADCLRTSKRLQEENDKLAGSLESLKSDRLNREMEIRDELENQYSAIIEEIEASWKKRAQDIEDECKEQLKRSVNQAELFYRERVDSIMRSKKRKRRDSGDNEESLYFYDELETENALVTSKVVLLKETVRNLKKENELLSTDKIRSNVELSLLKEELADLRDCFREEFPDPVEGVQLEKSYCSSLVKDLKMLLNGKKRNMEILEKDLGESKETCDRLIAESSQTEQALQESRILSKTLKNELDEERAVTESLKCQLQLLKEFKENCYRPRGFSSSSVSDFFGSEDVSTPEMATQAHVDTKLDCYLNYGSAKTSRKMSPDDSEADVVFRFSDGSAREDSGIESSRRSRGSTGVSDSAHLIREQYTQTTEDDDSLMEQRLEQLKTDYENLKAQYFEEKACVLELSQQLDNIRAVVEIVGAIPGVSDAEDGCLDRKESREIQIPAIPKELEAWAERIAEYSAKIKDLKKELSKKSLEMEGNDEKPNQDRRYTIEECGNVAEERREDPQTTQWNWKSNFEILNRNVEDIGKMAETLERSLKEISIDCMVFGKLIWQLNQRDIEKQERIDRFNVRLFEKEKRLCSLKKRKDLMVKKYEHLIKQLRMEIDKKKEKLMMLEKLFANNGPRGYSKFVNRKLGKAKIYHVNRNLKNRMPFWLPRGNERGHDVKCLSFKSRWTASPQLCEMCSESDILKHKETPDGSSTCRSEESSSVRLGLSWFLPVLIRVMYCSNTEGSSGLNGSNVDARQTQSDASDCSEVFCKCGIGFRDPGRHRRMSGWMKVRRMNARTELSCQPDKKRDCVNTSDSETDVAEWCFVGLNDYAAI